MRKTETQAGLRSIPGRGVARRLEAPESGCCQASEAAATVRRMFRRVALALTAVAFAVPANASAASLPLGDTYPTSPEVTTPEVTTPPATTPEATTPPPTTPEPTTPPVVVPPVVVAPVVVPPVASPPAVVAQARFAEARKPLLSGAAVARCVRPSLSRTLPPIQLAIAFRLSEPATVKYKLQRRVKPRTAVRTKCPKASAAPPRGGGYADTSGGTLTGTPKPFKTAAKAGLATRAETGPTGGFLQFPAKIRPGRYRLQITATAASGRSQNATLYLWVLTPRRV